MYMCMCISYAVISVMGICSNPSYSAESNLDVVVEHFLEQCASPEELIKSFKPSMSAQ